MNIGSFGQCFRNGLRGADFEKDNEQILMLK